MRFLFALFGGLLAVACAAADEAHEAVQWSGTDLAGAAVRVPVADRPTVVLFVRPGQPQSRQVLEQTKALFKDKPPVQLLAIASGKDAADSAKAFIEQAKWPFAAAADPEYAASGKMAVRVWPTAVIVGADGRIAGHIGGLPRTFSRDLDAYVQHALGRIDQAELDRRLAAHAVVEDSPDQVAARHLETAQRLADKGLLDQARAELDQAAKRPITDPALQATLARVLLSLGEPQRALEALDRLDPAARNAPPAALLRGRALVALRRFDEALPILQQAVRLNPDPAEGWYQIGLIHQHQGDWEKAAKAFRAAFETSPAGRKLAPAPPADTSPATQRSEP